ncbi:MAG: prsT, partial [Phycisphaerales bacterium]|nr:prsT [Phycisphaerales bacterium]
RYRALVTELPNDRQPRIMLAEFLARQPTRRDEAIAVLSSEFKPNRPLRGMESVEQKLYASIESVRRTAIRLGALATVTDEADRKSRLATIETETAALNSDPDISQRFKPALLRIQGGIELAKGKITDAINTLDSAMKLMNPDSQSSVEQDMLNDTLMEYAQAQLRLNQTGQARPALAKLVDRKPENLVARAMLADILIRERNYDAAKPQVELLQRFAGGSPEVQRMALRLEAITPGALEKKFKDMLETDRDKRFLKLQVAATLNNVSEVRRLASAILADNPADYDAVGAFVQSALTTNDRDSAIAVVAAAIKAKPGDTRFKSLADSLAAVTPEERQQLVNGRVDSIADPFLKALSKGELARTQGKPIDALAAFKEAQKLKPDDARGYEAQFQLAVLAQRFEDADAVLPDLARLNADQAGGALRRVQLAGARATVEPDADKRQLKFKEVVTQAQTLVQQNRELATASLLYAQLLQQTGDYTAAIDQFGQTLDKSPTNVDALVGMTDSLMRADRRAEAMDRINTLKSTAPNDARVQELDLNYQLRFGDPLKAIDALAAQVEKSPNDPAAAGRLGLALEQAALAKKPDEAKPYLARAGEVYSKAFERFPQDLRFLGAYAEIERRVGQPDAAEKAVEKAAADPAFKGQTNVVMLLADQYARSGKTEAATRVLTDLANSTKPAPVEAVQRLAIILAQQNRLQDAMSVLDLRPDDANVQRQRVSLLMDSGDLPGARSAVETTLAAHPDPETYLLAAVIALRSGDMNQCEGFANKVLAVRPNDVGALFYRGQVKMNRTPPDLDGSRDDLVKARDLSNNNVDVKLALAETYRRRGEKDAAQVELQQAWSANRENKQVLMRLVDSYSRTVPPSWAAVSQTLKDAKESPKLAADPDVLLIEAEAFAAQNDAPHAVASAQAALKTDPKNVQLQQRYFDVLLKAKAYRDVVAQSTASLTDTPDSWWLYRVRGIAFRGLDQKAEAVKAFDGAFNLASTTGDPNIVATVARTIAQQIDAKSAITKLEPYGDPALKVLVGEMLHDSGDISAATAKLEPMVADADKLPAPLLRRARQALGLCYLESSPVQAAKAKSIFDQLLKETPDDITLLNNLACVLLLPESGPTGPADAMKPAQRAYDLVGATDSPQFGPIIQDTYGYTLFRNNRVNDGIELLRHSAETARFPDVFIHLAEAYLTTDNLDGAQTAIEDAKARIEETERAKERVDPALKDKLTTLTSTLANKKAIAPGGG